MFAVVSLLVDILLHVVISCEVDRRERDVSQETRRRSLIQTNEAELTHDMNCTSGHSTFSLGGLTLYLQADFAVKQNVNQGW